MLKMEQNIFEEDMESENMQASNKTLSAFW